jgi:MFS family permease
MIATLRHRDFSLLWFGGLISLTGDWMLRVALPVHVYNLTGSTLATGIMFMAAMLPPLLLGSVAGVFVDRWDRKRVMVVTNLVLAAGLLPLLLAQSVEWLWLVYLVAFIQSAVSQFFSPAENALLPTLVGEEHLMAANSLNSLNNNLARLIGPALGGLIAGLLGLSGVALLDAATFLLAALLIALIRAPGRLAMPAPAEPESDTPHLLASVWQQWRSGLRLVRQTPVLRLLFIMFALVAVGEGIISVLFVPFVTTVLHGEALQLGWLLSAQAVGGLLGGVFVARLGSRIAPAVLLGPSAVIFGLIDLIIFNYYSFFPSFTLAIFLFILVGLPSAGSGASISTLLQTNTADAYRGRVFGALNTTFALLTLIGMALASTLGDILGIVPVINVQGYGYVLAGLIAMAFLPRLVRPPDKNYT